MNALWRLKAMRTDRTRDYIKRFEQIESLQALSIGTTVLFASLGLGEAVYRLTFLDFDGAKDRLPIEALFGLLLGYLASKLARAVYKRRKLRTASLDLIRDRNYRIRNALEAISPLAHPLRNQQSIRVIYEGVDQIEDALKNG